MRLRDTLDEDVAAAGMVEQANGGSNLLDRDPVPCALAFVHRDAGVGDAPPVGDQTLKVIERPFRVKSALGQERPCLGISGIGGRVLNGVSAADGLIFEDALQLPT